MASSSSPPPRPYAYGRAFRVDDSSAENDNGLCPALSRALSVAGLLTPAPAPGADMDDYSLAQVSVALHVLCQEVGLVPRKRRRWAEQFGRRCRHHHPANSRFRVEYDLAERVGAVAATDDDEALDAAEDMEAAAAAAGAVTVRTTTLCSVSVVPMPMMVLVIGTYHLSPGEKSFSHKLNRSPRGYVPRACSEPEGRFYHLRELSQGFKDDLALPLVCHARQSLGLPEGKHHLLSLPVELLMEVMVLLRRSKDLGRLARTCKRMSSLVRGFRARRRDS